VTPSAATQTASVQGTSQAVAAGQSSVNRIAARPVGFGLPCAKCKTYYAANLKTCPVCKGTERVSPAVVTAPAPAPLSEETPDLAVLEAEREKFLREFKAQMFTSQLQVRPESVSHCTRDGHAPGASESATVCQACYDQLQERFDVLEAALHIDVKEAAQIVYDAVWADTSDSGKTYDNAAQALLTELRKRAGITQTYGRLKPVSD
jgi:hypothetical protein